MQNPEEDEMFEDDDVTDNAWDPDVTDNEDELLDDEDSEDDEDDDEDDAIFDERYFDCQW